MISKAMMWIADHPSNPWLEEYLKDLGLPVFKYGDAPLVPKDASSSTTAPTTSSLKSVEKKFDAQDTLIKHLASKVKV